MKSSFGFFFLILLSLGLFGCQEEAILTLTGPDQISVNESVLFVASTNQNSPSFLWSSSNDQVITVDEGIVQGRGVGEATLRVSLTGTTRYQEKTITVVSLESEEVVKISEIAQNILSSLPNEVIKDLDLMKEDETTKATISYQSFDHAYLSDDGKITRDDEDHVVTLTFTISLNGINRSFSKNLLILKKALILLNGNFTLTENQTSQISASAEGKTAFLFTSLNPLIFTVDDEGIIHPLQVGKALLKVSLADDLLSYVTKEVIIINPIDIIGTYLKDAIPNEIDQDVLFLYSHPSYDIAVTYNTNSAYLDDEGKISRDAEDRYVTVGIVVNYESQTKTFYKTVVIVKTDVAIQLQNTRDWLQNEVGSKVNLEDGTLPANEGVYNRPLLWVGSDPGMIINQNLYPSITAKDVTLSAFFTIDNRKYQYEFKYPSKGVEPMDKLQALNRFMDGYLPSASSNRINLPYEEEVIVTPSIVYPNTVNRMRPGTGLVGQKMPGGVKYIVIHDTGMSGANDTAIGVKDYIHAQASSLSGRVASWHYTIDDVDCFQHVPDEEIAWHAGDGSHAYGTTYFNNDYQMWSIGGGNQNGIGIETCINQGGNYQLTLRRTAKLVASLLVKHQLGLDAIKQHNDFSGKNCPAVIRSSSGRWQEFLKMVEWHLMMESMDEPYNIKTTIDKVEAINADGIINQNLINDTLVNISFEVTLGSAILHYEYQVTAKGMTTAEKIQSLYLLLYNEVIPREANQSIMLPLVNNEYQAVLAWESSNPEILSNEGVYTKPSSGKLISLWVTIEIAGVTETKVFKIMIS